jgi:hypothetical protein
MSRYLLTKELADLGFISTGVSFYHPGRGVTVEYIGSRTHSQPWGAFGPAGNPIVTAQGNPRLFETAEAAARAVLNLPRK